MLGLVILLLMYLAIIFTATIIIGWIRDEP
nr:MAG TPA: hypothetical protein [Bacteriophage sp.]